MESIVQSDGIAAESVASEARYAIPFPDSFKVTFPLCLFYFPFFIT